MVVILHPEPVPLLNVQWPHQSPTLMLTSSLLFLGAGSDARLNLCPL